MAEYATFDFPYHQCIHAYPPGDQTQFGGGYSFAADADRPLQKSYTLIFATLLHVRNPYTGEWLRGADTRTDPNEQAILDELKRKSIWALNDFYDEHLLFKPFYYQHYVFGQVVCRFAQAFQMPKTMDDVKNIEDYIPVTSFEIKLIEQPL